ncbi:GNAT family protein [Castellaniella sp. GW247-6E4]|uniref:GNAT family N-acetyltransferase n=1 Tax=Castellaniella sp. GW247-6E4 TaxID=3140380 RepID=UPI0033147545
MTQNHNEYGQPLGESLPGWATRPLPGDVTLQGAFCRIEPLNVERHAQDLYTAYSTAPDGRDWTYMFAGPFQAADEYLHYAEGIARSADPKHYAVIDTALGKAVGTLSLMRIDPTHGVIEVGNVAFSPLLKQKRASTEAQFLLMQYAFDELRYRRYEWKCDSLNAPSRKAADRLGFRFEGIFRQAVTYKGRSRDTAWFAIIDKEWPSLKAAFLAWLSADNFDRDGRQVRTLAEFKREQP